MRFINIQGFPLRGWLSSAVVLAGVAACGGDRGSAQGDQSGTATTADTGVAAAKGALIERDSSMTDTASGAAPAER